MSDFVLTCESAADRTREFFASRNIPVVCFHYEIDDVVYTDDLYQSITPDEFFAQIAAGAMPKTSQVSVGEYKEFWEPFVAEGKDVLHLALSSGISGTYGSACVAAQMLADRYPQGGKVRVIDSLAASSGFGLLLEYAADVRDSGASLDETAAWIEEHKLNLHHWFFSTDLSSYLRGGRISAASAIIGTALKICPLMTVDCDGKLSPREKIRTKKRAISEMAKTMMAHVQDGADYSGKCIMSHSACREDAEAVAALIEEQVPFDLVSHVYMSRDQEGQNMLDNSRFYYHLIPQLIEEGQKNGEFSKEDSAENLADNYASLERGMIYDWCLKGGSYSLREKGKQLLPIYLQSLRKAG